MKKNKFSQYFIFISVFTFITVFVFIVQKSYIKLMGPIIQARVSNLTRPINPNLDTEVLNQILKREEITQYTKLSTPSSTSSIPSTSSGQLNL